MSKSRNVTGGGIALALALATLGFGSGRAFAADYLRGAYAGEQEPRAAAGPDWAGVYGGVHAGMSSGQTDPRSLSGALAKNAMPNAGIHQELLLATINIRETNKRAVSYGAFVGMNWLWDDVVLGIEGDYSHSNLAANSSSGPYALFRDVNSVRYTVSSSATSRARISDWATLRGRVGYAAGMFMPYLTAGVAFGSVDSRATTSGTFSTESLNLPPTFPTINGTFSGVVGRRGITYGSAVGAGVDMQIIPNTFLRAEWQYINFASGGQRPDISINTARVAGGVKF